MLAAAQKRVNEYHAGVLLSTVNIESVGPPPEAADAFRDVASAKADSARIVNESQGYANDVVPKARGEAQKLLEESAAYKERKINEAAGDASRFTQIAAEYDKAAQVTGHRLYVETMEQILPRIKKFIVDQNGNLDLTIIRKGDPRRPPRSSDAKGSKSANRHRGGAGRGCRPRARAEERLEAVRFQAGCDCGAGRAEGRPHAAGRHLRHARRRACRRRQRLPVELHRTDGHRR